ncbi:CBS protein [Rhizoctonia solani]|uniref:CBS protein n=1 Tax=Rhizoctonia solani TaxID=456999 RepID=A0A8H7IHY6_9AGAM|nr:CBS protein [Rhizoctonia solani]
MSRIPQLSTSHIQSPSRASPYSDRPTSPHHSVGGMASNLSAANMSDSRKKQNKRDEAIRKKIEGELSRKRTISTNVPRSRKTGKSTAAKGTVAALRPSPALTVPENMTVSDASQLCAAKRTDCVLVVDDEEGLSGIFTAKDLAFRVSSLNFKISPNGADLTPSFVDQVSAEGLDPRTTPVSQIMTRGPMVTRDTTSATEALQLMVQRGFRHLPVCNDEGNVVGLLDITKVFHEALEKLERGSSASAKLHAALEGVQSELGNGLNPQAMAMMSYVASLREKTTLPDLTTVMDSRTQPATVSPRSTVRDAAKLMKENRTTAVCIMEPLQGGPPKIAGIFTSKDVVLRVIAAGLDPNRCSVVRVMTPHPDVAEPSMTVHDALKKMYDVLKLTYATLEQINSLSGGDQTEESGPMWGRFFDSFQQGDDNESAVSGSNMPHDTSSSYIDPGRLGVNGGRSPHSEVHPNDSASVIEELHHQHSSILEAMPAYEPIDDGTYVFKFRTPSGRTHRFQARQDNFENLRDIIAGKLESDPFFEIPEGAPESAPHPEPHDFTMSYTDSDGDTVELTSDSDVADAVRHARQAKEDRVIVYIHGGKAWDLAGQQDAEKKTKEAAKAAQEETRLLEKGGATPVHELSTPISSHAHAHPHNFPHEEEKLFGVVPRDMVLPASVGFLGVVIIVVFAMSRSSNRY